MSSTSRIVSFLMYEVLVLIRGTRAVQMAVERRARLLLPVLPVADGCQLETVNWVIRNLVGYVVFAIIVLFQADIRRALAHFGRAPFFRYFERRERDETIEEIVVAATNAGRAAARAPSSSSSGRSACATTSRAASRSTRRSRYDLLVEHLPARVAAARRRGHHPGRSRRGRGLFPAADGESAR